MKYIIEQTGKYIEKLYSVNLKFLKFSVYQIKSFSF